MSHAIQCNRCEKFDDDGIQLEGSDLLSALRRQGFCDKNVHLCFSCMDALLRWWKDGKTSAEDEAPF